METKNQAFNPVNQKLTDSMGKIIAYGLPILYFLISVMFYLRTYDSAQIKITLVQMGGTVLLCAWLVKLIEENAIPFFRKNMAVVLPLLLFLLSGTVSWLTSPFFHASTQEFTRRLFYITFALIALKEFDSDEKIGRLQSWLFFAAYVATIYGVIQWLDVNFFPPNPEPGLDPFIWRGAFGKRVFSTFGNPNFFGDFLVVMSPITLAAFMRTRKFKYLMLWALIALNVIWTGSKGAWLGLSVGVLTIAFLYVGYFSHAKKEKVRKIIFTMVGITVVLLSIGMYVNVKKRTDSVSFRIFTWLSTLEMIDTHPALGTGIGTFYVTYPAWRRPQIFYIEGRHNTETDHPENEYLEVLYDEGIVGFGIFIWLVALSIVISSKNLKSFTEVKEDKRAYYQLGLMTALIAQLAHNMVCVSLRFVSSGVFLWLVIGLIMALNTHNPLPQQSRALPQGGNPFPKGLRGLAQLLIVACALYCSKIFYGYFDADVNHNIAIMYSKQGQWIPALEHYETVVRENPSFIMSQYFMGNVYNDRWIEGDPERAIKKYGDVWKLAPNYVQSHHQAGMIYFKWGTDEKNRADQARQKGDMAAAAAHEKAKIDLWQKAIAEFEKYRTIDPVFPLNYYREATIFIQMGDYDNAARIYAAHLSFPQTLKNPPHSIWVEEWWIRRAPELSETCIYLGNLYYVRGQYQKAEEYYKMGADLLTTAEGLYAKNYRMTMDYTQNKLPPMKSLAALYQKEGKAALAAGVWNRIREMSPGDPDVQRMFEHK